MTTKTTKDTVDTTHDCGKDKERRILKEFREALYTEIAKINGYLTVCKIYIKLVYMIEKESEIMATSRVENNELRISIELRINNQSTDIEDRLKNLLLEHLVSCTYENKEAVANILGVSLKTIYNRLESLRLKKAMNAKLQ